MSKQIFPDRSKTSINAAGRRLAEGKATKDDLDAIENWRASHNYVLNTFQATLRGKAKSAGVRSPVQRIKRLDTIMNKLRRFPGMQFSRMHDIVGCRLIFENIYELNSFRKEFNRSRFAHKRRTKDDGAGNKIDAYNYIATPKSSGYRGIHDVFEYRSKQSSRDRSSGGAKWNGLHIEIQYRTSVQHAWATAVEICDNFTENHGKFSEAPNDYLRYFILASEVLRRAYEPETTALLELSNTQLKSEFEHLETTHGMLRTLAGIQPSKSEFSYDRHTLLISGEREGEPFIEIQTFSDFRKAVGVYFELERSKEQNVDVVLVAAEDAESVRFGFKNYFSDAREFVGLLQTALDKMQ